MNTTPRVRFAPSPTGALHIGGVRTALYNYLFARRHGGSMILRIEDTDTNRYVEGAEKYIIDSLQWLGIEFDEGVSFGGKHAPYRQSERKDIYRKYVDRLIADGKAYHAFDTPGTRGKTLSDSQLPIRCLHTNVDEQLSGTARRRSKPTHSQRRKICSPHQDRAQRKDCR